MGTGVLGDHDVVRGSGGVRVEGGDQRQSSQASDDLGADEAGRGAGGDSGEGVGEHATDRHGGVGE